MSPELGARSTEMGMQNFFCEIEMLPDLGVIYNPQWIIQCGKENPCLLFPMGTEI